MLREVRNILHQRPDLGVVAERAVELHRSLDALQQGPVGASALTTAELRLLPFLATHLSFPEIGERLHISRHTVKTQAISVYRKFGVSSRSEAIQHAQWWASSGRNTDVSADLDACGAFHPAWGMRSRRVAVSM